MKVIDKKNRDFGYLISAFTLFFCIYSYFKNLSFLITLFFLILFLLITLISLLNPIYLTPFVKYWLMIGELLGRVISPVVLGIIFFCLISPIALLTKLFGRDELMIKRELTSSYWIERQQKTFTEDSFKNQF